MVVKTVFRVDSGVTVPLNDFTGEIDRYVDALADEGNVVSITALGPFVQYNTTNSIRATYADQLRLDPTDNSLEYIDSVDATSWGWSGR